MKRFLKGLVNFILVIILFITISILTFSYGIDNSMSYNNIKTTVKETIKDNIKKDEENKIEENNILESIYEEAEKKEISREDINTILSSEKLQDLASDFVYSSMIENKNHLSEEEINKTIDEAVKEINKDKEIINSEAKEELKNKVFSNYDQIKDTFPIVEDNVTNSEISINKIIKIIANRNLRIISIASVIVSSILIILFNFEKLIWLRKIAITSFIAGICNFILSYSIIPIVKSLEGESAAKIAKLILAPLHKYSLSITIISIVMLIIYFILKKAMYKQKKETDY